VPPDRAATLLDALLHLREASGQRPRPSLERLAGDLSPSHTAGRRTVALSAPRGDLHELLLVALDEAAETLAGACADLLRTRGSLAEVHSRLAELGGLVDLLETVEADE